MKVLSAFLMSFSMFCAIPCPIRFWDERLRPMMTAVLPLVGLVIGAAWAFIGWACEGLGIHGLLAAVIMAAAPWMLSGFIHVDGFMDCCDGILSRRELEERRRILKDSHTGSFAVISMVLLAAFTVAAFYDSARDGYLALLPVPVATRALSAIAVQRLRSMGHSQYAAVERPRYATAAPAAMLAASFVLAAVIGVGALACTLTAALAWCAPCSHAFRQFDGMSGDVSGYAITIGEAAAAVAFAFV